MGATPWDGEVLAAELDDQRGPRAFVHEPGGFEPILQQQGGETFLCVNDHLGMPKDLVSADGLVVWTAAHSAYGRVIAVDADLAAKARYGESASSTAGARGGATGIESPFRLLGQVADEDAEIGWTRFRCFDAETGRWLSPDPLGIDGGLNSLGLDGAPSEAVDPYGLSVDEKPHGAVLKRDLTQGPHAPDTPIGQVIDRAQGTGNPQGRWNSTDAAKRAAGQYQPGQKSVPISPGDGEVIYPLPGGGVMIRPADQAVTIPKKAGSKDVIHTFPIGPEHPDYNG